MKFSSTEIYVSSSVNSIGKCISWQKWLACGMSKSVVLIDQTSYNSKIIQQFTMHKDIVTCISWVTDNIIVSADNSGHIILWKISDCGNLLNHTIQKVENFQYGVTDISAVMFDSDIYIACCSEGSLTLLKVNENFEFLQLQSKTFIPNFVHSMNTVILNSSILITCGLSDGRVICQIYNPKNDSLSTEATLTGHEDTITSIDSIICDGKVLIATASLDTFVRVWSIYEPNTEYEQTELETHKIDGKIIQLTSVLSGHENWVTSVSFRHRPCGKVVLVSTSMDKSVIVWFDGREEEARLGQVGGNGLGFIGGSVSPCASMIASVGYQGAMIVWSWREEEAVWRSVPNCGGHFDCVEDVAWESAKGRYLISVSKDQTTRLHAPWAQASSCSDREEWHEIGRPQVHGYDLVSVASLGSTGFVSGADEKIARVFGMNRVCGEMLRRIVGADLDYDELLDDVVEVDALGLSNVVVAKKSEMEPTTTDRPREPLLPKEEAISGLTLWPELAKLYGHVYELFRVAAHPSGALIATSCKSAVAEHADVILWQRSSDWTLLQRLHWHRSTVVRMVFSHGGDRLVTVSKDRQWALWVRPTDGDSLYRLQATSTKPHCHSKVIWDAAWSVDDAWFVTVSRDRRVLLWHGDSGLPAEAGPIVMATSVNAVAVLPVIRGGCHVFVFGQESGEMLLVTLDNGRWGATVSLGYPHHDCINRLAFRPQSGGDEHWLLASCSKDRFVKVHKLSMEDDSD